jgi:NAD(P)-dependent dehydrogenase (short-subunit alcohol dehydrogenase family)
LRELNGRVAVITGAASGIGRALARACAREGMKVVLADVAAAALDRIAAELAAGKAEGLAMTCDVSRASEVEELADVAFRRYGGVHLLCNNAGVAGTSARCWEIGNEEWERDLGVNLWGVIHGVRAFLPRMLEQGEEGHIVNTASVMGLLPAGMAASYGVSKAGVVALSEALAIELAQAGSRIGVSVLCPAAVATDIAQSLHVEGDEGEAVRAAVHADLQKGLTPEQVAEMTLEAVRAGRFGVLTHADTQAQAEARLANLLSGRQPETPRFGDA